MIVIDILRSFGFGNPNRGEDGMPKSARYGGCKRDRISSQSLKRSIRENLKARDKDVFGGVRTRQLIGRLKTSLVGSGVAEETAQVIASAVGDYLGKIDNEISTKTVLYLSEREVNGLVEGLAPYGKPDKISELIQKKGESNEIVSKTIQKVLKGIHASDIADIALFGRMVANDESLRMEAASGHSHALSVSKSTSEVDFFSAVDEESPEGQTGAGFIDSNSLVSSCYHQSVFLDLDLLRKNLGEGVDDEQFKRIVEMFLRAVIMAAPKAKQNAAFAAAPACFALARLTTNVQPYSLIGAFAKPIEGGDVVSRAKEALRSYHEKQKAAYGSELGIVKEVVFDPDTATNLDTFCKEILANV